jgi:2-polyprenyl-3-methyl-5-hydroxy-6-metoxy-1,4-benzoquinol methylase
MAQSGEVRCQERGVNRGTLNWDQTSEDYSKYRPGYPDNYFLLLQKLGIGLKSQDILDIGTGTGALALPFAEQGAHVTGVDISKGQIEAAKTLASQKKLNVRFIVAKAEETGLARLTDVAGSARPSTPDLTIFAPNRIPLKRIQ